MRFSYRIRPLCAAVLAIGCGPFVISPLHAAASRTLTSVTAFVDVAVVPMDQERVLYDQTVLVEDGRITVVGPVRHVRIPAGATRIDGRGKFLLPGLADMHAHLNLGSHVGTVLSPNGMTEVGNEDVQTAGAKERLFLWLANGVTTIRNMDFGTEFGAQALQLRALAATGTEWLPHIYTAAAWAPMQYFSPGSLEKPVKAVMDSVATYVAAYKAAGYDYIKIHDEAPVMLDSVLAAAKRVGIPVVGHVPLPSQVERVLWGYKSIEHPLPEYLWNSASRSSTDTTGLSVLASALHRAGVWNCPTQSHYDRLHFGRLEPRLPNILKVLQDSGVKLLTGSDEVPWQGVITRELQAFVAAGLTPYQALLTSTQNVALYFGILDQSGTITVGKRADMILLTGNPLQDVRYTAQPAGVMLGGRWLSRQEIDRRLTTLTLPTVTAGDDSVAILPVKRYWSNVVDEQVATALGLFAPLYSPDSTSPQLRHLRTVYQAQRRALIDSLGVSDHYVVGTQRVFHLIVQQLGEFRMELTPEQRIRFDERAKRWIQRRTTEGFSVTIPGVPR